MGVVFRSYALTLALLGSASVGAAPPEVIEIDTSSLPPVNPAVPAASIQGSSELVLLIEQLQQEVRTLRGELEKQAFQLKSMERQQLDRYRDLDRRISTLGSEGVSANTVSTTPAPSSATTPAQSSASSDVSATADVAASSQTGVSAPKPVTMKDGVSDATAYRDAFALVRSRDYAAAVTAFKAFLRDYPGSEREANVHYWLGEIYHAEKKLEEARESFALVLGQYPEHSKAPQAAYKLGVIYHELGDKSRSKEYMDYVLQHYPKSKVAPLAQDFSPK